ncbi:MFS transporter [Chloroflexota bacterium]
MVKKSGFRSAFSGLIPLFILAHFVHHLVNALPTPLLPMIHDEFSLDYTRSGFVISAFQVSYGIAQVPSGWLSDRIGAPLMMTIGICGVALAGIMVGLSQTYIMLLIAMILLGALGGGYHPASPPLISASVTPKNRGRALGLHMIGGSASFFLSPIIAVAIASNLGWRSPFIILSIPTMIFGILLYLILKKRGVSTKTKAALTDADYPSTRRSLNRRQLITFFTLSIFTHGILLSMFAFIPLFLVDNFGTSKELAGVSISLIYSSGLWASPLSGYLSDRWGRIPIILAVCFLAGPVVYLLTVVPYGIGTAALLVISGMIYYVFSPVSQAYIVDHATEKNRGILLGIYFFGNMEGGGLLTPLLGYAIDHFGFITSFTFAALSIVTTTIICSLLLRDSS